MQITVRVGDVLREPADLAVLALIEDSPLPESVAGLLEPDDFCGRAKQSLLIYPRGAVAPRRLLLIGLGKAGALSAETVRQAAARAAQKAQDLKATAFAVALP
ncbi:MAG: M17 family peptidase N-terminal domain-containing protein, partial [Chloroflexales bacterium]